MRYIILIIAFISECITIYRDIKPWKSTTEDIPVKKKAKKIPAAIKAKKSFSWIWPAFIFKVFAAFCLLALVIYDYYVGDIEKQVNATSGKLKFTGNSVAYPNIKFGEVIFEGGPDKSVTIQGVQFPLLKVWIEKEQLKIICNVRDSNKDPVARIQERQWHIYKSGFEYNNDDNGFEMETIEGNVFFQMDYRDGFVNFSGVLFNEQGLGVFISHDSMGLPSFQFIMPEQKDFILPNIIEPIFAYPRDKDNLGVRLPGK